MKKRLALITSASVLLALVSCNSLGTQALAPGVDVESLERQAPVTPTPNPSGQLFDPTLQQGGLQGGLRGGRGFF